MTASASAQCMAITIILPGNDIAPRRQDRPSTTNKVMFARAQPSRMDPRERLHLLASIVWSGRSAYLARFIPSLNKDGVRASLVGVLEHSNFSSWGLSHPGIHFLFISFISSPCRIDIMAMSLPTDHSNRAPGFIACSAITSAAALVLVSLRTYVRLAIVRRFGIDDYTIHMAMAINSLHQLCILNALRISGLFTAFRPSYTILRQTADAFTHQSRAMWPHQPRDFVRKHRQISANSQNSTASRLRKKPRFLIHRDSNNALGHPSLELNFAILAACIPTLRPLFRYFDSSRAGSSGYPLKKGFNKHGHNTEAHGHSFRSDSRTLGVNNQYTLTSIGPGKSDERSNTSTEFLRNPGGIVKTTDVHILV
ncbi:MAG: hypothetical protein Q9171_003453 [Xanthocarpia ochracea]